MTGKKKNEILPERATAKESAPERRLARGVLSTAIREATSSSDAPKAKKARNDAIRWIRRDSIGPFSFGNVVDHVFEGNVDSGRVRDRLEDMIDSGVELQFDDDFGEEPE